LISKGANINSLAIQSNDSSEEKVLITYINSSGLTSYGLDRNLNRIIIEGILMPMNKEIYWINKNDFMILPGKTNDEQIWKYNNPIVNQGEGNSFKIDFSAGANWFKVPSTKVVECPYPHEPANITNCADFYNPVTAKMFLKSIPPTGTSYGKFIGNCMYWSGGFPAAKEKATNTKWSLLFWNDILCQTGIYFVPLEKGDSKRAILEPLLSGVELGRTGHMNHTNPSSACIMNYEVSMNSYTDKDGQTRTGPRVIIRDLILFNGTFKTKADLDPEELQQMIDNGTYETLESLEQFRLARKQDKTDWQSFYFHFLNYPGLTIPTPEQVSTDGTNTEQPLKCMMPFHDINKGINVNIFNAEKNGEIKFIIRLWNDKFSFVDDYWTPALVPKEVPRNHKEDNDSI